MALLEPKPPDPASFLPSLHLRCSFLPKLCPVSSLRALDPRLGYSRIGCKNVSSSPPSSTHWPLLSVWFHFRHRELRSEFQYAQAAALGRYRKSDPCLVHPHNPCTTAPHLADVAIIRRFYALVLWALPCPDSFSTIFCPLFPMGSGFVPALSHPGLVLVLFSAPQCKHFRNFSVGTLVVINWLPDVGLHQKALASLRSLTFPAPCSNYGSVLLILKISGSTYFPLKRPRMPWFLIHTYLRPTLGFFHPTGYIFWFHLVWQTLFHVLLRCISTKP
uniref:Uncharacterized protein n=1 Tax=Opuntia streptacantha TaxID=393608 RepID=A0A7C8ZJM1_OPUST